MATQVIMPKLSDAMEEGRVLQWLKKEGDKVQGGDVLASIETDKAEIELEAFGSGVLRKILAAEGDAVPVGKLIAVIAEPDEDIAALVSKAAAPAPKPPAEQPAAKAKAEEPPAAPEAKPPRKKEATPAPEADAEPAGPPAAPAPKPPAEQPAAKAKAEEPAAEEPPEAPEPAETPAAAPSKSGWIPASPIAKRMAREAGIELGQIKGSGPGGRIIERDVEAHLTHQRTHRAGAEVPEEKREYEEKELSTIRKTIAARMLQSKGPIPHFTATVEADMGAAEELRRSLNAIEGAAEKLSVNHILIKAAALALRRHPAINAAYHVDRVQLFKKVHIGLAVALEDGLIVPVIRECERKSLGEVARESRGLIERARARKLRPEEYSGGTFTISNLGMFEVVEFSAIIDPAQGAILAVGAIEEKPVVVEGQVAVRKRMRLTGSFDHRIIDGALGARFLQELKKILENPVQLLL